jgi:hypothetical protein
MGDTHIHYIHYMVLLSAAGAIRGQSRLQENVVLHGWPKKRSESVRFRRPPCTTLHWAAISSAERPSAPMVARSLAESSSPPSAARLRPSVPAAPPYSDREVTSFLLDSTVSVMW